ncbi:MAG: hypothetical protein LBB38_03030 [Puniceicoccales bacterium]|jgi:hypothetical protein|nr:hypothetical protein [Puniceicoccales bacterium]
MDALGINQFIDQAKSKIGSFMTFDEGNPLSDLSESTLLGIVAGCFAIAAAVIGVLLALGVMAAVIAAPLIGYCTLAAALFLVCALYPTIQEWIDGSDVEDDNEEDGDEDDAQISDGAASDVADPVADEVGDGNGADADGGHRVHRHLPSSKASSVNTLPRMVKLSNAELKSIKSLYYSGSIKGSGIRKNIHIFQTETGKILRTSRISHIRRMPNLEKIAVRSEYELSRIANVFSGAHSKTSLQVYIDDRSSAAR